MSNPTVHNPFPDRFSNREWSRYVRAGRNLVEEETSIQFALGDLTLKMVKAHKRDGDHGVILILTRYADQIGINLETLLTYRHVAIAWPKDQRMPGVPWSIHKAFDTIEDRAQVIRTPPEGQDRWTLNEALNRAGRTPHRPLTKDQKIDKVHDLLRHDEHAAKAVEELLTRREVAHRVMAKPRTQRIVYQAHHENRMQTAAQRFSAAQNRGKSDTAGRATSKSAEPAVDYTRASREALELIGIGTSYLVEMQRLIPTLHVNEFTDREVRAVLDNHKRIRAALDWCDSMVAGGEQSPEEELARIIAEGDDAL